MTPEERQQIRERAQWLLYAHEHELRPNDEEKMCRYCAVAVMDIPALLAALEAERENKTLRIANEKAADWEMRQYDERKTMSERLARLQQERDEAMRLLEVVRSEMGPRLYKEIDTFLRRLQGEARTP